MHEFISMVKFIYSEKATKFCEISSLLLSTVHTDKIKVEISQNFVAFSEYMNFASTDPAEHLGMVGIRPNNLTTAASSTLFQPEGADSANHIGMSQSFFRPLRQA